MNLDEYSTDFRTKVMVYGSPKSGKTALVGKLAESHKLYWFDLENGVKTLLNPALIKPEWRKNITVFNVPDHRLNPVAIDTIRDIFKGGAKVICQAHGKVNCLACGKDPAAKKSAINLAELGSGDILVIDSLSQLARSAMNRVTIKEITKPNGEEYKCTYTDYAQQGALMEQVLSLIQVLDINIVCISHELESESLDNKQKIVPVAGTRNASLTCGKYFDAVVYCSVVNKKHRAFGSSTYSPTIVTGSRLPTNIDTDAEGAISLVGLFNK